MTVLALDVGTVRIGVAVTDETEMIASPLAVIRRTSRAADVAAVACLASERKVGTVVVGDPVRSDTGARDEACRRVDVFVSALRPALACPVVLWDERFSSREAEQLMIGANASRAVRRRKLDSVAAALILESYLAGRQAGDGGGR